MKTTMTLERLWNPVGGNHNGGSGSIDWMTQNYCPYCRKSWYKGTPRCPDCHRRVRVCPRKPITIERRRLYKQAQVDAAARLKAEGWKLPPARVSCKRWL